MYSVTLRWFPWEKGPMEIQNLNLITPPHKGMRIKLHTEREFLIVTEVTEWVYADKTVCVLSAEYDGGPH